MGARALAAAQAESRERVEYEEIRPVVARRARGGGALRLTPVVTLVGDDLRWGVRVEWDRAPYVVELPSRVSHVAARGWCPVPDAPGWIARELADWCAAEGLVIVAGHVDG